MGGLAAEKRGSTAYPWAVIVTAGPSAGFQVGPTHKRKCDAAAWIAANDHLPWDQVRSIGDVESMSDLLATVPTEAIASLLRQVRHLEAELEACRTVLLHVDGSAMSLMEARRTIKERAA